MGLFDASHPVEFNCVAGAVVERASSLLRVRVCVTDDHGRVVASSDPAFTGQPVDLLLHEGSADWPVRVPLRLNGQAGEVVVAGPRGADEAVPPRLAEALVDLVVNQVTVVDQLPNQRDLKNTFIYDLLHGAIADRGQILRQAKLLALDLAPPRAVILIDAAEYVVGGGEAETPPEEAHRRSQHVIGSVVGFFSLPDDTICAYSGDGEIAVLKASDSKSLGTWVDADDDPEPPSPSWANLAALKRAGRALLVRLQHDTGTAVSIGIGRYHPGVRGPARSYQDARAALSLGRRFRGQSQVHCLDGLGIAAFVGLADERTKVDLARHLLSPLDHEPELIGTLDALFAEDRCPSRTAARLGIHRNTLAYRLDKIASLTGLDPRRFDDAVQIRLALLLRSLGDEAAAPPDRPRPQPTAPVAAR